MTARDRTLVADTSRSICWACSKTWNAANHRAVAARHHDATGHVVETRIEQTIQYGTPEVDPAQTAIEVTP